MSDLREKAVLNLHLYVTQPWGGWDTNYRMTKKTYPLSEIKDIIRNAAGDDNVKDILGKLHRFACLHEVSDDENKEHWAFKPDFFVESGKLAKFSDMAHGMGISGATLNMRGTWEKAAPWLYDRYKTHHHHRNGKYSDAIIIADIFHAILRVDAGVDANGTEIHAEAEGLFDEFCKFGFIDRRVDKDHNIKNADYEITYKFFFEFGLLQIT